jgi:hypothetical protein
MAHQRKLIRARLKTILTGLILTGANVFASRTYPFNKAKLPGLLIYTDEETSETGAMQRSLDRIVNAKIVGYVKSTSGVIDDALDDIAEEVEAAIEADPKLNGLAIFTVLESSTMEFDDESDKPVGIITMTYQIHYRT